MDNELEIINDRLSDIINRLESLENKIDRLRHLICAAREEQLAIARELEERRARGLTGTAAIEHHNEWMRRYGLYHLIISL